jgi:quercetin dioxygenase-like cupin family protein
MFYKSNDNGYTPILPGIRIKTLTYGELTLFTEFKMEKGHVLPKHSHVYEQTGYLLKGNLLLTIGTEEYNVTQNDSWCIPCNVEHWAQILSDSVAIEVFAPVRKDYLMFKQDK